MFSLSVLEEEVLHVQEELSVFLCVCFLAILHPLPCCWNNSFWEPAMILIELKLKQMFIFISFSFREHTGQEERQNFFLHQSFF